MRLKRHYFDISPTAIDRHPSQLPSPLPPTTTPSFPPGLAGTVRNLPGPHDATYATRDLVARKVPTLLTPAFQTQSSHPKQAKALPTAPTHSAQASRLVMQQSRGGIWPLARSDHRCRCMHMSSYTPLRLRWHRDAPLKSEPQRSMLHRGENPCGSPPDKRRKYHDVSPVTPETPRCGIGPRGFGDPRSLRARVWRG